MDEHKNLLKREYLIQGFIQMYIIQSLIFNSVKKISKKGRKKVFF